MHNTLNRVYQDQTLSSYFLLTYLIVLLITQGSVEFAAAYADGFACFAFLLITFLCYGVYYLLPAILITGAAYYLSNWDREPDALIRRKPAYIAAIFTGGLTTLLMYANAKVFSLYGMFINGFIINLLMTPGGIQSLGGSGASDVGFALIAIGFFAAQALLLWSVHTIYRQSVTKHTKSKSWSPKRKYIVTAAGLILATVGVHMTYAANDAFGKSTLTSLTETIPFFHPVSARRFFARLGYATKRAPKLDVKGHLHYPLRPIAFEKPEKPYNIVWLTSESWRADMLDPQIMPNTWEFASQAHRFTQNYSGGNGTRMGVFSMFTGLPGNYWFQFLRDRRGAAVIDLLQKQNYQMNFYTSALFTYPEFDKTIFSHVPAEQLHALQDNGKQGWENDRINVSRMLEFIDQRDQSKPFFTFMFFESPHARYHFPPESVIRQPYRDDINYATLSKEQLRGDIIPIKNRYINAVHHLDSQFARVFNHLAEKGLLDSTIVVMVGDHGEEFMEHGFWGHNSTFVNEQIRTPLVIWVPGKGAGIHNEMSSHMDIPATLMPLLGVTNPAADYSIGQNLLSGAKRIYTYVSDWNRITYIDKEFKTTISIQGYSGTKTTAANDKPLPSALAVKSSNEKQTIILKMMNDLGRFLDQKTLARQPY